MIQMLYKTYFIGQTAYLKNLLLLYKYLEQNIVFALKLLFKYSHKKQHFI